MITEGIPLAQEPGIGAQTLPGYLREVTTRYAGREALVAQTREGIERVSYAELWERSVTAARALVAAGLERDNRVGILMTNRVEFVTAVFGTALAGGVAVVFSTFATAPELSTMLGMSGVSMLLFDGQVLAKDFGATLLEIDPELRGQAPGAIHSRAFPALTRLVRLEPVTRGGTDRPARADCFEAWPDFLARGAAIPVSLVEARAAHVMPGNPAGLFFSSGTTGMPKGILHPHRAFAIQWWRYPRLVGIDEPVRSLTVNGLFWSGNIAMTLGLTWTNGGTVVLTPVFDPAQTLELIEAEQVSFLHGRPHQWARLQEAPNWLAADLGSLRYVPRGELLWTHPTVATDWAIPMGYGNTETMSICTSNAYNRTPGEPPGSFGTPLPGNSLKIVDPDTGAALPAGQRGEICVKGPTLMLGYIGRAPEETFDEAGFFHTGDSGYVDAEGRLYWEGRINEIIKTGGANVSPVEIDDALALYPGVRRAQTVGVPHDTLGEMIVSCIVPHDQVTLDAAAITAFLKERLASYKVPRRIVFLRDDELEITGSGKVKATQLRRLVSARLADDPATPGKPGR